MLSPIELKIVISTLTTRKAWLRKTLDTTKIEDKVRNEHLESFKLLESAIQKLTNNTSTNQQPTSNSTPPPALSGKTKPLSIETARILIAEDDKDSAKLLFDILEDTGFRYIDMAEDGMIAFDKIKSAQDPYHIILCDWDMPGLTGLEVHGKAKASNTLKGAHFIMVTAVSEASRIRAAITQGVNDYIVKPVDIDILESKLRAAIINMSKL